MSNLTLSSTDVARLGEVLRTLVTPLEHANAVTWIETAMRQALQLLGAHQSLGFVPQAGAVHPVGVGEHRDRALRDYVDYYGVLDKGLLEKRSRLNVEIYDRRALYGVEGIRLRGDSEFNTDWAIPNRLADCVGIGVQTSYSRVPAALHFYHDDDSYEPFGERGLAILRLLLPAYKAGVETWIRLHDAASRLADLIDGLDAAVLVTSLRGDVLHQNRALGALLAVSVSRDSLQALLLAAARAASALHMSRDLATSRPPVAVTRELTNVDGAFSVHATVLPAGQLAPDPVVMTTLTRHGAKALADRELAERFKLTSREITVARLLAQRCRSVEIAQRLGISIHTVRRHTENVLRKLGVSSRDVVEDRLRG